MSESYVPERCDVVWLDFDPTKGKEIGKYRPALVLSSQQYHQATGLMMCCPISTRVSLKTYRDGGSGGRDARKQPVSG